MNVGVHPVEPHEYQYGGFEVMGDCGVCGHVKDDPIHVTPRKRVYMVKRTLVERCFYSPEEIKREFGFPEAALPNESFEDFVIRVFERFDGSIYGDEFFPGDASPEVGVELEERWDDE